MNSDGYWWDIAGEAAPLTEKAFVGTGGIDFDIAPGANKTPMGFYYLGDGFYTDDKPDTTYPLFKITNDTYWVEDTKSKFYNKHVEGTSEKDWNSADHMISSPEAYKYGLVVNYNTANTNPNFAGKIFMYCGSEPTTGGIAVPEETMKTILEWLSDDSRVFIFIT